jgi:hypothetical protein
MHAHLRGNGMHFLDHELKKATYIIGRSHVLETHSCVVTSADSLQCESSRRH